MNTKSRFRPTAARPARKPAKKFKSFRHSSELAPKALKTQGRRRPSRWPRRGV